MKFLNKIERRHPNWGISNLMMHVCILNGIAFFIYLIKPSILNYIFLSRDLIFAGQIWRLVSFIAYPPTLSLLWFIFAVYLYYFLGRTLEARWGTFKFSAYYLLCMVGTIIAAFITGGAYTGTYINASIFLAFAYLYPNYKIMLFFILPIEIKYLGLISLALTLVSFIRALLVLDFATAFAVLASFTGLIVFFGVDFINDIKLFFRRQKYKRMRRK